MSIAIGSTTITSPNATPANTMKLKRLLECNPRLDLPRIRMLQALYRGGRYLLNDDMLNVVFPRYSHEKDGTYGERKKRAFYENIFAQVINQISAGLAQDPATLVTAEDEEPDDYWLDVMKDATPPTLLGGNKKTFDQLMRESAVCALTSGFSWLQGDLPAVALDENASAKDQEDAGALRAYLVAWDPTHVTDWEEDNGELCWVRTYECKRQALLPTDSRTKVTHCWTIWTDKEWCRYEITLDLSKNEQMPNPEADIAMSDSKPHSFGCVPWIKLDLCGTSHMHIGDMMESLCRAHFNRINGESFQWTQSNFQQLYEFLAPEVAGIDTAISEAQSDPDRANRAPRSPGAVHVRGAGDRAEYIAPNMGGADIGVKATQDLRDAIFRVAAQMALSQDTSGAMIKRSADSKKQDAVAQEVLLGAVGKILLTHGRQAISLLAMVRGDDTEEAPDIQGYERFDVTDVDDVIQQSLTVEGIQIPSARYQIEHKYRMAVTHLGDSTTPEIRSEIREQLESAITQDAIENPPPPPGFENLNEDDPENESDDEKQAKADLKPEKPFGQGGSK